MNFVLILVAVLAGLFVGIFVNYLSDILPRYRHFSNPICVHCLANVSWRDYLLFKKCSQCNRSRSVRTWITLGIFSILSPYMLLFPPNRLGFWLGAILIIYLGIVAVIDIEHRVILNEISLIGIVVGIPIGVILHGWVSTLIGGLAGFGIMLILYYLGVGFNQLVSKIRGETLDEVALGFGDVNLSGILGLILGWPGISLGLLFAILLGGLVSGGYILIAKLLHRYQVFTAVPYAPFLILGTILLLFKPSF
jgi:prepilin signal peptidase PulO-like enzyme (type II secretory pathway)